MSSFHISKMLFWEIFGTKEGIILFQNYTKFWKSYSTRIFSWSKKSLNLQRGIKKLEKTLKVQFWIVKAPFSSHLILYGSWLFKLFVILEQFLEGNVGELFRNPYIKELHTWPPLLLLFSHLIKGTFLVFNHLNRLV